MRLKWMLAMVLIALMCAPAAAGTLGAQVMIVRAARSETQEEPPEVSIETTPINIKYEWNTEVLGWREATETKHSVITIENLDESPITATLTLTSSALPRGARALGFDAGMAETCVVEHIATGEKGTAYLYIETERDGTTDGVETNNVAFTVEAERLE